MVKVHDAPCFQVKQETLSHVLSRARVSADATLQQNVEAVARLFSTIPYENLTKIIKTDVLVNARSALRYPDELLNDWIRWGTGGTCFSLTSAMIAIYNCMGIEAHPLLADRHYGVNTHCALAVVVPDGVYLLDPGFLLYHPVLFPSTAPVSVNTGYNVIELIPKENGSRIEMYTLVKGSRKLRLVYKSAFIDAVQFEKAWESSFAWEMMKYPVLTRVSASQHIYLQGDALSVRNAEKTNRQKMTVEEQYQFISGTMGINPEITRKALEILKNG
ncbi:MAG TPA: arylamine N-acetyltransferase [Chitinispirillaceae bacterium]|nr:arylamine N-acetyltransferase [Chitinispirillaceae bacterium]